jgi:hypothetical protein
MAFDSSGTLHLTCWSGYFATNPNSPAIVYYLSRTPEGQWSVPQIVDDSYISGDPVYEGKRMGGRNPSLTLDPKGGVWIAWQDHRNCGVEPPYNGINNIEIYCDWKPAGSALFSADDVRLTETSALHMGDNGYCPRIQAASNGKLSVLWYDFHQDGWISDIFMMTSDGEGAFDFSSSILDRRITDSNTRVPIPPQTLKPAFGIPDLAISPEGRRYAIWSQDFGGSIGNSGAAPIYFAELPEQPQIVPYTVIVPGNDGYWYPPKIKLAPSGDIWVIYTVREENGRHIEVIRRRSNQTQFDAPIVLTGEGRNQNADLAIDREGRLHVVWEEYNGYRNSVLHYALWDAAGTNRLQEVQLTPTSGAWAQPSIALDHDRLPNIVYCEGNTDTVGARGDIWFVRAIPPQPSAGSSCWMVY